MTLTQTLASLRRPDELYELLDPDVMWYSANLDSNFTCNDKDDAVACIERGVADGLTGRFEVLAEHDDIAVVQPVLDPPRGGGFCLLVRFRDGLIVALRDFASPRDALAYAGIVESGSRSRS